MRAFEPFFLEFLMYSFLNFLVSLIISIFEGLVGKSLRGIDLIKRKGVQA